MIYLLWLSCWISFIRFSFSLCVSLTSLVLLEEPVAICCPLYVQSNHTVTWYRQGSDIPITTDKYFRIHQRGELLWFNPATLEDSGTYQCVHNSTKGNKALMVFKNNDGLCYSSGTMYSQKLRLNKTDKLVCPDLHNFRTENAPLDLEWSKGCSPGLIEDLRFNAFGENLIITNPVKKDEGIYICKTKYMYMGKHYNISRAINLTVYETPMKAHIEIISPTNNSVEVKLGSSFDLECNVSVNSRVRDEIFMSWEFSNKTLNNTYLKYKRDPSGKQIIGAKLNISKMKYKDYGKYLCAVWSFKVKVKVVYVMLKHPAPNHQIYLIGGLVSPLFVILATLVTYKFFKVDIVLWYRDSCRHHLHKGISDGKIYDAYVLYPQNISGCVYMTDIFVLKMLPEILEKKFGYKLFILGRDDLPGQALITTVDKVIKLSRRVIIILMPDLFSERMQISTSAQEIAVYSALIQDETKVILIELDKIKDYKCMPESVKYLKQKHGILTWTGDFSETSQMATKKFWKNVRYQMPAYPNSPLSDFQLLPAIFHSSQISEG